MSKYELPFEIVESERQENKVSAGLKKMRNLCSP